MKKRCFLLMLINLLLIAGTNAQLAVVPQQIDQAPSELSLSGTWKFNAACKAHLSKVNGNGPDWHTIQVPGEWTMQGFSVEKGNQATYYRSFEIPEEWKNCTVYLRCDAVFSKAQLVVNGQQAVSHHGPMVAFEKNVTKLLNFGKENRIAISVTAETMGDTLMSGTQYAAHQMGGILRKIYLYAVPKVHMADLKLETELDQHFQDALLKVSATLRNNERVKNATISARLISPQGEEIPLADHTQEYLLDKHQSKAVTLSYNVTNPLKWDAEHPNLYQLQLEVNSAAGKELIVKNIGFRKIEVVGNQVFINGSAVKLKGVNHHEVHPLLGRSLTPELWKQDVELLKKANVNYLRTSHYPTSEEFVEWCDKIGIYVELENPISWVGHHANTHWKTHAPENPEYYSYFEEVAKSNMAFFRNHPSIIMWSMANESKWTNNWSKLADFYAKEDATRPATFHDQGYGGFNNYGSTKMPVANIHYPGAGGPAVAEDFERPLLFGEYAHLNTYNRVEIVTDPGVRDAWGRGFKSMWEGMYKSRGCLGGAIWSGIDDVFYLPEGRAVGYGEWGPIDGWRREKPEYYHMKKTYSPVKVHNLNVEVPQNGKGIALQVENRFDFTDMEECTIKWTLDNEIGEVKMALPPKQTGILFVYPEADTLDGKILNITFISPQGNEVENCAIEIGDVKRDSSPFRKIQEGALSVGEDVDNLIIRGSDFKWAVNLENGQIIQAEVNDEVVMTNGAALMMLDLTTGPCETEHSLVIPAHNATCTGRKLMGLEWKKYNDSVVVKVELAYDQAEGVIAYRFEGTGLLNVSYEFTSKVEMNPRQWGLVFTASPALQNLHWYRKGLWSSYPDNHIGRTNGMAVSFGEQAFFMDAFGKVPNNDWCFDANALGTNDFRATRENIYWASLTNEKGVGVTVLSDGRQAFRSYVNPQKEVDFLVADFSTGGGDMFFNGHYSKERKPLKKGSVIGGKVTLQLVIGNK